MAVPHNMNTGLDQANRRVQSHLQQDMERQEKEPLVTLTVPVYEALRSAAGAHYDGKLPPSTYDASSRVHQHPYPPVSAYDPTYDTMQAVAAAGAIPDTELASRARDILKSSQRIVDRLNLLLIKLRGDTSPENGADVPRASGLLFQLAQTQELQNFASIALDELETLI